VTRIDPASAMGGFALLIAKTPTSMHDPMSS